MPKVFFVIYKGIDKNIGPVSITAEEPSDAAKYFWAHYMNPNFDSHVADKLYVLPRNEVTTFSVKGLVTLERD